MSDINEDGSFTINDKNFKDTVFYHRPVHHKYYLSIKEVEMNEIRIGYIFKFESSLNKNIEEKNASLINKNNQNIPKYDLNKQENNENDKSEISVISFANKNMERKSTTIILASPENPFGIIPENTDLFFSKMNEEKENEFTIDMNHLAYKQIGLIEKSEEDFGLYETLRQQAVEKISKVAKQVKKEDISEEEYESSSGSNYSSGEESSSNNNTSELSSSRKNEEFSSQNSPKEANNKNSQKIENNLNQDKKKTAKDSVPNIAITIASNPNNNQLNPLNMINTINKHKDDDYYHVNVNNITFYLYNYNTGFVEALKDQKYKISQVVKQTNAEKEKLNKMNAKYIANPKLVKEKKRGNINNKNTNDVDEFNSYNEQTIKLKEIQKELNSKEKQTSIVNLCIFSFIVLILIIGTSVMSILINFNLRDKTYLFYSLIKNSIELYKNILVEISIVRELIIIGTPFYHNYYDNNISHYFTNFSKVCYEYYLDTSFIISNLTTNIHLLLSAR